jgi:hypothetical protein
MSRRNEFGYEFVQPEILRSVLNARLRATQPAVLKEGPSPDRVATIYSSSS